MGFAKFDSYRVAAIMIFVFWLILLYAPHDIQDPLLLKMKWLSILSIVTILLTREYRRGR